MLQWRWHEPKGTDNFGGHEGNGDEEGVECVIYVRVSALGQVFSRWGEVVTGGWVTKLWFVRLLWPLNLRFLRKYDSDHRRGGVARCERGFLTRCRDNLAVVLVL